MSVSRKLSMDSSCTSVRSEILQQVKGPVDLLEVSSKWGVTPTTLQKVLEGRRVSKPVERKIQAALRCDPLSNGMYTKPSFVKRLLEIHRLYQAHKTLRAVGRLIGLSGERVRQLLLKGANLGLFPYRPIEALSITKEKILADYKNLLILRAVARVNQISSARLQTLLSSHQITKQALAEIRIEHQQHQCVNAYIVIAQEIGHHPTTTELQRCKSGPGLERRIRRLWGSFPIFRKALKIPPPPRRRSVRSE